MRFDRPLVANAERQIRSAALVAALLGAFSFVIGIRAWRERLYLDAELIVGFFDSILVLVLAYRLTRRSRRAAWILLVLAFVRMAYARWLGLPLSALLPQFVAAIFFGQAIYALSRLRSVSAPPATP